jgi:hypothetical protein
MLYCQYHIVFYFSQPAITTGLSKLRSLKYLIGMYLSLNYFFTGLVFLSPYCNMVFHHKIYYKKLIPLISNF